MTQEKIKEIKENGVLLPAVFDCIFKSAFLDPELKDVLIDVIKEITKIPVSLLKSIEVRNVEYIVENKKDKQMRSDIIVNVGKLYLNIEMNHYYYDGVLKRNEAYLAKLKASTYKSSESYLDAGEIIQINFDDFYHYKNKQDVYKFLYKEEKTNEVDDDETVKYHICLPNVWDRCYNKEEKGLSRFERYCLILKTKSKEYAKRVAGEDELMGKLVEKLGNLSLDEKMIGLYNAEVEEEKIRRTMEESAKRKGHAEGLAEGRAEGIKEGFEQGIEQGIEQGVEQNKKATIINLYNMGMSIETIAKAIEKENKEVEEIIFKDTKKQK